MIGQMVTVLISDWSSWGTASPGPCRGPPPGPGGQERGAGGSEISQRSLKKVQKDKQMYLPPALLNCGCDSSYLDMTL